MVGQLRDPDLAPNPRTETIVKTLEQIEALPKKVHTGVVYPNQAPIFTDIISIGIGGLAPSVLSSSLLARSRIPAFSNSLHW